jgi:uncharacterized membrane protein YfcA
MDLGLQAREIAWLAAMLLAAGIVTGLLSGLFGVGGGGILVPVLYEFFRILGMAEEGRMHLAVGTSLAIIIPTSLRSFRSHYKRGAVDMRIMRSLGPAVAAGVLGGIGIAALAEGDFLKTVYVISGTLLAIKLFAGGDRWRLGEVMPGAFVNAIVGFCIGAVSTLIGIGGGVFISGYMTLYGRAIHQAVATSSGFGPIIAIPAAIGYAVAGWGETGLPPGSLGYVSLLGLAVIAPASVLTAPLGVRFAHGISRRKLEIGFACFMTLVAIRFAVNLSH